MIYRVTASSLNLRDTPDGAIVGRLPIDTLLESDLLVAGTGAPRVGFDDPETPQPARLSNDWVRVVKVKRPGEDWVPLSGFAALEWLAEERAPVDLTFVSPPRISKEKFIQVLVSAQSPAAKEAESLYRTVRAALVRYAPGSDGNNPARYGDAVVRLVEEWSL